VLGRRHHGVPGAGHIGVDGVAKGFCGDPIPGSGTADTGVRDDNVETAQFADGLVDGGLERVEVADVRVDSSEMRAKGPEMRLRCLTRNARVRRAYLIGQP